MNHYTTQEDVIKYAQYGVVVNPDKFDYIFDAPTDIRYPGRIWLTQVEKQLADLVDGSKLWFVASALQDFQAIIIHNESGPSGDIWPHVKNIKVGIIPDAQLKMQRGALSYAAVPFKISGVGVSVEFGHDQIWRNDSPFQRDTFRIYLSSERFYNFTGHAFWLVSPDGQELNADGIAGGEGSFTLLRALANPQHGYVSGTIQNVYAHTMDGEPAYIGATASGYYTALKHLNFDKYLCVRPGSEFQLQHFQGTNSGQVYIHNANFNYPKHHRNWQDAATQFSVDCGKNYFNSIFIDGFGSNGLTFYGAAPYIAPDGNPNFTPQAGDEFVIKKAYVYDGHLAMYVNAAASRGVTWRIEELYVGGMTDEYANTTGNRKVNYYLEHAGTDTFIIDKLYHDGSRPLIAKDMSKFQIGEIILLEDFPRPKYKYIHYKFTNWSETVGDYHPILNGTKLFCKKDSYYVDREHGFETFYFKCLQDHLAHVIRPKDDTDFFQKIVWDDKGVPSDSPEWNPVSQPRDYPGDNFTHLHDSPLKDFFWITEPEPVEPIEGILAQYIKDNELYSVTEKGTYKGPLTKV